MRPNRAIANSSLAFIDVMSCGLGAVIMLLVLVDFDFIITEQQEEPEPVVNETLTNQSMLEQKNALMAEKQKKNMAVEKIISDLSNAMLDLNKEKIKLDQAKKIPVEVPRETSQDKAATGELIGLSVEGRRILVAFDTSASMSNEKLIDIILGISDTSGQRLAAGPKWIQAKRILMWLLRNAPESSEIQVLGYSEKVKALASGWRSKQDVLATTGSVINNLSPSGGTSLESLVRHIKELSPQPTNVYIITDGLPTMAGSKSFGLKKLKDCFSLKSKKRYVSGECRVALFNSAVGRLQNNSSFVVNIILLPLEGDPKAAPLYWKWANQTAGILFSPAQGWPPK